MYGGGYEGWNEGILLEPIIFSFILALKRTSEGSPFTVLGSHLDAKYTAHNSKVESTKRFLGNNVKSITVLGFSERSPILPVILKPYGSLGRACSNGFSMRPRARKYPSKGLMDGLTFCLKSGFWNC